MKGLIVIALMALSARYAEAACANACSGHGRCTNYKPTFSAAPNNYYKPTASGNGYDTTLAKKDTCTCFLRTEDGASIYDYTGYDCSLKTCPSGKAHGGLPSSSNSHDQIVECSGVGACDRVTGLCQCPEGFTGKACNRRTCPNDCSGRGVCASLSDIVADVVAMNANLEWSSSSLTYTAFDKDIAHGCICDAGFRGPDCSLYECPSETDPMGGKGKESGKECSGRGVCDESNGVCKCHSGYYGAACNEQLSNVV